MVEYNWIQIRGADTLMDISEAQDGSLCMINFVPSIDDFWVFGNSIYKDYYVYHNPERAVMGWAPTTNRLKEPLQVGPRPTEKLEYDDVDYSYILIRLGMAAIFWVATIVTVLLVFTTSCGGIAFLN